MSDLAIAFVLTLLCMLLGVTIAEYSFAPPSMMASGHHWAVETPDRPGAVT